MTLPVSCRNIVSDDVAEHVFVRLLLCYAFCALTDDGSEFDLIIKCFGDTWIDFIERTRQTARLLVQNAVEETIRFESPIRGFTRVTAEDVDIDGVSVAAGTRLLLLYASANRDERKWDNPDRFDITRPNAREHLGFGKGRHVCAGQHLAKLEMMALLEAMLRHFPRFEASDPVIQSNNLLRGFESIAVRVLN